MQNIRAEAHLVTRDLAADLGFFGRLGFRLDRIWPADDPRVAQLSGLGLRLRLEAGEGPPGALGILADDPVLRVWINGEMVHDLNQRTHPQLRDRLRSGYIGIAGASSLVRFRGLRVLELPGRESWQVLYGKPEDLEANWQPTVGKPVARAIGPVLREYLVSEAMAALGVPTLDGLGIDGEGAHTLSEYALISSIAPRQALIKGLLETV